MIDRLIHFSMRWRIFVVACAVVLVAVGIETARRLPLDAVPDITSTQVQINTVVPGLAPEEMENLVTFPLEVALSGIPRAQHIRSLSQFGLSQVTVVFDDRSDIYWARQLVFERVQAAAEHLPPGLPRPQLAPISTGLGEIYYLLVEGETRSLMERRTILDWFIAPHLRTVPGVIEVNRFGGEEKQYQVLVDPAKLVSHDVTLHQVVTALAQNNANAGGGYLVQGEEQHLVRSVGWVRSVADIGNIVVTAHNGTPIYIRDLARVQIAPGIRQGALTRQGNGEGVVGIPLLLMGENSRTVVAHVKEKLRTIAPSLPRDIELVPFLDRTELIAKTIRTAITNLLEGGLLVVLVLFLFLLQLRAGLIVSSVIPLSMLCAIIAMYSCGISANLMSLGAIDFGLIVDAAVIIVENCVRQLAAQRRQLGRPLSRTERLQTIAAASIEVRRASQFGELIIIAAYLPLLTLGGVEGKMFRPMAFTVVFALSGALLLSLTFVPALCALFLREPTRHESPEAEENPLVALLKRSYAPLLRRALRHRLATIGGAALFCAACAALFPLLGAEFLPELDEGAIAIQAQFHPSMGVEEAVQRASRIEQLLLQRFPEIDRVVTRIGRPEIATDPMLPSQWDILISLKPTDQWRTARSKAELVQHMAAVVHQIPGGSFGFTQPIKMRMQELIEGVMVREDVVVKLFGDDLDVLTQKGAELAEVIAHVPGAVDISVEQSSGLPRVEIRPRRDAIARYGINVADINAVIETAIGGKEATQVIEGNMRFPLVVRFAEGVRHSPDAIGNLLISTSDGRRIPLSQLADIVAVEGPVQISRENGQRRLAIRFNVRGRDLGSVVEEAKRLVEDRITLPPGYFVHWGGMYEHLVSGRQRLAVVVPLTFFVIFLLLSATFRSGMQALVVFTGIPFALTGGILALLVRGMHFSMSAGIGFIAVSGVAVLNGVVLVTFINQLRTQGIPLSEAVIDGALTRLRPVLMTALVASVGFVPMALSTSVGAEVQRPLATVVIGGLITATVLTLFVLPTLYTWMESRKETKEQPS
ncbi:MAG: CusA/CzcA family heavy metal efflux RND transporter [Candidatus Binatia bacterium]|nr:CusA/CzcA family heavy metal efflux RND transporter [Candidatus Binatia bacterium]